MKIKKDRYSFFSLIIFFLSVLIIFFSLFLSQSLILYKKEIPTTLRIGETPAFNLDNSTLSFGTIAPNTTASRTIKLENNYSFPIIASFSSKGNISKFLIFEEKVKLLSREEKVVTISTILPGEEDYGNYSGKILVVMKREI